MKMSSTQSTLFRTCVLYRLTTTGIYSQHWLEPWWSAACSSLLIYVSCHLCDMLKVKTVSRDAHSGIWMDWLSNMVSPDWQLCGPLVLAVSNTPTLATSE